MTKKRELLNVNISALSLSEEAYEVYEKYKDFLVLYMLPEAFKTPQEYKVVLSLRNGHGNIVEFSNTPEGALYKVRDALKNSLLSWCTNEKGISKPPWS